MPNNTNYGELFCEAIDIIAKQRTQEVMYDKTVLGTIEDDSQAADGIYTVSYNQTKFQAFSQDTTYKKGNSVYIQIPQGDWNEQKNIVSRKSDKNSLPITYLSPFDTFVDITGNLITKNPDTKGLLANGLVKDISVWSYNDSGSNAPQKEEGMELASYTRLAMRAEFKAWLQELNAISGSYGLKLRIAAISDDNKDYDSIEYYDYEFDCSKMRGNPYAFESYFQQEIVFDITEIYKIKKMSLIFYQKADFYDNEGKLIPTTGTFYGEDIEIPLDNNLFVKDIYLALGYDSNEFDTDTAQIYSFDSTVYGPNILPLTENHKKLELRWVHKIKDYFKSIDFDDGIDFTIYWYRNIPGTPSHMARSGVGWSLLSAQYYDKTSKEWKYEIHDRQWLEYNEVADTGFYREPSFNSTWLIPDTTGTAYLPGVDEEHIKAIVVYDGQYYISNTLTFYNTDEVINKVTVDADQALTVACLDGTYGNYLIYNLSGSIIDHAQSDLVREWQAMFNLPGATEAEYPQLTNAESIEWIIPRKNSMIIIDEEFVGADDGADEGLDTDENFYHIFRYGNKYEAYDIVNQNTQRYRIRSFYSQSYSNNTIQCKVVKDGVTYLAVKELSFGPAGTNGSDYTFVLDFEKGDSAVTVNGDMATTVRARLYDYAGKELDISGHAIDWGWRTDADMDEKMNTLSYCGVSINRVYETNGVIKTDVVELKCNSMQAENYCILRAKLTSWEDYPLVAYLPIPVRSDADYGSLTGATSVIYDTSGNVMSYYANPYELYWGPDNGDDSGTKISNVTWSLVWPTTTDPKEESYMPKLRDNRLVPLNFYVEGTHHHLCVQAYHNRTLVWTQPLLLMQNRYPSTMINKWDGSLTIDEKNNAILAAKIIAGRKEAYQLDGHTQYGFSGVMMGALGEETSEAGFQNTTGLYGYHQGQQSFGFDQSGKGFIGKTGKGRILLDGNNSTITSAGFTAGGEGVKIDLDSSPFIQVQGMAYTEAGVEAGIQPILYIADGESNKSFLQSANYALPDEYDARGLHIDLNKGYIHAKKNFKLETEGFRVDTDPTKIEFLISDPGDSKDKLFSIYYDGDSNRTEYFLQSRYFDEMKAAPKGGPYPGGVEGGIRLDLQKGKFEAVGGFSFTADNFELNANPEAGKPYFGLYDGCNPQHTLLYAAKESFYLQSCGYDPSKLNTDENASGMKISFATQDKQESFINAYGKFDLKAKSKKFTDAVTGQEVNGILTLTSDKEAKPISIDTTGESKFSVGWDGSLSARGGNIGGWYFYQSTAKNQTQRPPDAEPNESRWNVLYCKSKRVWKQESGETVTYGNTVFGANQDNVIAVNVPDDKLWTNHNFANTDGDGASLTITGDGSLNARKGRIAGWYLNSDAIRNFEGTTKPSGDNAQYTILYSGSDVGADKYSIETTSINITGTNSKLTIGNFTFNSNTLRVDDGTKGPPSYALVIDANGNFGVGNVQMQETANTFTSANFKVDKDGNVTVKSAFKVDNEGNMFIGSVSGTSSKFKIDKDGNLYVGPNGNLFNLKIDNDGNLYIAPSGESYKVAITKAGELSLGSNWQAMPYFKVTAAGKVLVGPKSATETGDGNYYFELTSYGKLRCGGVTIEEFEDSGGYTYYLRLGTQAKTRFSMSTTTAGNTYLRSLGRLYISASTDSAVYIGGLTFGIADNDYATYKISINQGRVLARVVQDWCSNKDPGSTISTEHAAVKKARYAYFA